MASQPVHAHWCPKHEWYYRGQACPLCQPWLRRRMRPLERERVLRQPVSSRAPRRDCLGELLVLPDRAKLEAALAARGWSRAELARRAGLGQTHVRDIAAGRRQGITQRTAQRLAEALETTVAALTIAAAPP
ncbi:MAG: hypothetical protein CL878_14470 [Dehalococcoidia bacterium]|nr:hypothetical protein [Dehalococcoidia bacterium]